MFMWMWSSSLGFLAVLAASVSLAADAAPKPAGSQNEPTTITAQKMTVRNQENKAYFEGSVVLTKGTLVVHSDTMIVSFKKKEAPGPSVDGAANPSGENAKNPRANAAGMPGAGSRAVSMVEATGRVRIEKEGGTATCQRAVYYEADEKIVLTGEPTAWQKGTRVNGKVITMYLAEDRSVVEGESRVLIEPESGGGR
jgi:lipopolysaccharide export system protein LptA